MYNFILSHKKAYYAVLITLLTLMLAPLVFSNNLWGDECYTMLMIQKDIPAMWTALVADMHPFLYYWIVKFFVILFGESIFVVRIVSIIPCVFMMILGATVIDSYFGKGGISVATFFICLQVTGFDFLKYALELRMYSWALFFVTASGLLAYAIHTFGITKKRIALFIVASVCAAATHYYALLAVAIIYGMLFVLLLIKARSNIKYCLVISAITIVLYLPGLFVFIKQFSRVSESYWISALSLTDTILAFAGPISAPWEGIGRLADVVAVVLCLILGAFLLKNLFSKNALATKHECICAILFISVFFLWLSSTLLISALIRPLYTSRYAFPTFGLFWLGVVIGVRNIPLKKIRTGLFALLFVTIACSGCYYYQDELEAVTSNGTNEMIEYMSEADASGEEIYALATNVSHLSWTILPYHFPDKNIVTVASLDLSQLKEGEVVYFFSATENLNVIQDEIEEYNIGSEYIYAGVINQTLSFYLYKLYLA